MQMEKEKTLEELLLESIENKPCRLCTYGYFNDGEDSGLCKLEVNARHGWPKRIGELQTCPEWKRRET